MKKFIFLAALVLTLATLHIPQADAYFTTGQNAFTVNNKIGVYTIKFEFGHAKYDIYIPVHAFRDSAKNNSRVTYTMLDDKAEIAQGESIGIILSPLKVKNGMYMVPKGKKATFTLLAFYTPSVAETESNFRLQVTDLPFSFDRTQQLQLNESELRYYTTNLLTLIK